VDNCLWARNPDQKNTDGDAFGDACDRDADGDGVCQVAGTVLSSETSAPPGGCPRSDDCPLAPDPNQSDSDGDGAGDACDSCPNAPDVGDTDRDGRDDACDPDDDDDGVLDASDNCPKVKNPGQQDLNGNGIGAACDPAEQVSLSLDRNQFNGSIRHRLDRNQILDLPIFPERGDPRDCKWCSGDRQVTLSVDSSVPLAVRVIDDEGNLAAAAPLGRRSRVSFVPKGDFRALAGEGAGFGRTYLLELAPLRDQAVGVRFRVGLETSPVPGQPGEPGEPRPDGQHP
jgi:hypothetical protein